MTDLYWYRVSHPAYGAVEVEADSKLHAMHAAARIWLTPWSKIARECAFERLEAVTAVERKKQVTRKRPAVQTPPASHGGRHLPCKQERQSGGRNK